MGNMRRRLLLTRHAEASWAGDPPSDHERALSPSGEEQTEQLRQQLQTHSLLPQVVICSTAVRARDTAARLAAGFDPKPTVQQQQALYQGGLAAIRHAVEPLADDIDTVMVVGHNPAMSAVASRLAAQPLALRTATCVALVCEAPSWEEAFDASWTLLSLHQPELP